MLKFALLIATKDLRIAFRNFGALLQAVLLGLTLIFIFSLSQEAGQIPTGREAASFFWLASVFCQILIFNQLYSIEEINDCKAGLAVCRQPVEGIWLGKMLAAFPPLLLAQAVFMPGVVVFLNQNLTENAGLGLLGLFLTDIGLCSLGSILGAIGQGQGARDALLSVILFPLLTPLLLAGTSIGAQCFGADTADAGLWLGVAGSFDSIFLASGLVLFGFLYKG